MAAIRYSVEVVVQYRQWLQTLDEALWIIIEDHTLVQQALRIEDSFQLLHHLVGLLLPLVLYKRCHVTTRAMLSLQRTVVLLNHQTSYVAHHLFIALHLTVALETLVQDKVIVSLESMTVDTSITITMISNHLLQLHRCLGQVVNMEGHILNQTRGAYRTRSTHRGEDTRADGPVLAVDLRILSKLSRDIQTELRQAFLHRLHLLHQLLMGHGLGLS